MKNQQQQKETNNNIERDEQQPRLSFSAVKTFRECGHRYKLEYLEGHKNETSNIHLVFGSSIHTAVEKGLSNKTVDMNGVFVTEFDKLLAENKKQFPGCFRQPETVFQEFRAQGQTILSQTHEYFDATFPSYKIISQEEEIYIPIEGTDWMFKGFIDMVLEWNDKIIIIDSKTSTWGWDRWKKSDELVNLQLQLYKAFWCKKHDITAEKDIKKVNVGFLLLKRTPKKNNLEFFRASGSPAKLEKATKLLKNAIFNIERKMFLKNKLSCNYCPFYKTELCP